MPNFQKSEIRRKGIYDYGPGRSKYRILVCIALITISIAVRSQTVELPTMTADRPGIATSPFLVTPKHFQFETGSAYERASGNHTIQEMILFNTFLTRYCFNKVLEGRIQADFSQLETDSTRKIGLNLITAGLKFFVFKGKGIAPVISLMVNMTMPFTVGKGFKENGLKPLPSFYLLMQNDITEKFNISYNFGIEFLETYTGTYQFGLFTIIGGERYSPPVEFAAICLEYDITGHLTPFIESYNWFGTDKLPKNFVDIGCAYLINNNIQVDLSASMSLQDFRHYFMISGGFAWRIPLRSDKN